MIKVIGDVLFNGAKEVGKLVAKEGPKLLSALISALIVLIFEEISKYYSKRKLHKLYYNEGFKNGAQLADKMKEKLNDIIKDKKMNDKEKFERLNKYRTIFKNVNKATVEFEKEWNKVNKDTTLSDSERKKLLDNIQQQFHKKMKDLGVL